MAAQKKPTTSRSKTQSKTQSKKSAGSSASMADNVFWSVTLFALGILILLLAIIKGESAWTVIHNFILGLFGVSAFLVSPVLIYASVLIAMDKAQKTINGRIIQGTILIFLFSAIIQIIFVGDVNGVDFLDKVINLYEDGTLLKGGGLCAIVIGYPLIALFKRTGATIIILLMTFVVAMLFANKTIIDFFRMLSRPAKGIAGAVNAAREDTFVPPPGAKKTAPPNEPMPPKNNRKDFNIDIPIPAGKKSAQNTAVTATQVLEAQGGVKPAEETPQQPAAEQFPVHPVVSAEDKTAKKAKRDKLEEKVKAASADLDAIIKKASTAPKLPAKPTPVVINDTEPVDLAPEPVKVSDIEAEIVRTTLEEEAHKYKIPPTTLLAAPKTTGISGDAEAEMKNNAETLVDTLKSFGVSTRIVDIHRGPTVTRYELQPSAGVKVSKITGLSDDIALNLAAAGVRIEAPIPGKAAVGVEVPNKFKDTVTIRELLESDKFKQCESKLSFVVGRDIEGNIIIGDIAKMPHVIIAGTTGSGKSVCTNSIIMSILFNATPDEVRIVLIDPKMVEFKTYEGIPHLLIPVVTDPRKAAGALSWAVQEMLKRYKLFADSNVRDLKGYNEMAKETDGIVPLPQIVIAIDELADLMMAASNEVEDAICRLAQMARAAGMHLIIATQRPTVDVITGLIKANIPSRIALTVSSQIDSRTIIDVAGAEKLLGYGDMLYYPQGIPKPVRVQGCFCATKDVEAVVDYIKNGGCSADYSDEVMAEIEKNTPVPKADKGASQTDSSDDGGGTDEMVEKAIEVIIETGQASTSYLQRRLKLGYSRAARIIDELEQMGVVGAFEGSKPRAVLISKEQWYERRMRNEMQNAPADTSVPEDVPSE